MRAVIQRVSESSVIINGTLRANIGLGLLVLVGIEDTDTQRDINRLARKIANLRIFDDAEGVMNCSVREVDGEVLVVSQFTLMADTRKGNRPSYIRASKHEFAVPMYEAFCRTLSRELDKEVKTGVFAADMKVSLLNDGPVTIFMDTAELNLNNP